MADLSGENPHKAPFLLLALLFLAWQLPGVIGRDPWKSDEAYTMGLVHHVLESGDVVVPELGGEPFMQKPTLYFATAAALAKMLAPVFPPHVGARMASLLFNLLTLVFVGLAAREINGRGRGWPAAVMFPACIGPLHMAHFILTDLALVAGMAMAIYGMTLGLRRSWVGGLVCGTGAGLAFMAKGLLGAGLPGVTVLLLPLIDAVWRKKTWFVFVSGCILAALPWALIWPAVLFLRSPQLFSEWFVDNNFGRFHPELARWLMLQTEQFAHATGRLAADAHLVYHNLNGPKAARGYMFVVLPWYAFPASAFAVWTLWKEGRAGWKDSRLRVPLIFLAAGLLVFTASRDGRELYAMPLVVPLLLIGARCLPDINISCSRLLHRWLFVIFTAAALVAWLAWLGMILNVPPWITDQVNRRLPGYVPAFQFGAFICALLLTAGWMLFHKYRQATAGHLPAHFAVGVALLYGIAMTLFLPAAEWQMSYERQFAPLRSVLPAGEAVLSRGLGEPQRAMLHYYAGLKTRRLEIKANRKLPANWLLTETDFPSDKHNPGPGWERVWQDRHEGEWFQLFRKIAQ